MCPYANFQIHGFEPMPERPPYPLLEYLKQGIPVSVNTDNPGISAASLTDNFLLLPTLCPGITRLQILETIQHAANTAFLSANQRQKLIQEINRDIPYPNS